MAYDEETVSSSYSLSDAHIFLPAAGFRSTDDIVIGNFTIHNDAIYGVGSHCYYWSSLMIVDSPYDAWCINLHSENVHDVDTYDKFRYFGQSVRAVIPGE